LAIKIFEPRLVYRYIAAAAKPKRPPVVQYKYDHQNHTQLVAVQSTTTFC